ncbi:MAG: hypothetical protein OEW02_13690, partial [Myxococcales bacterium]|nr:hypothetical protein [Myxococcales bacterium]
RLEDSSDARAEYHGRLDSKRAGRKDLRCRVEGRCVERRSRGGADPRRPAEMIRERAAQEGACRIAAASQSS